MHKRASTQIKSPGYFLQKLISVNPSIDFSRQFGIGRYFLQNLLSPTEKNPSFDCLGNWKTHFSRWAYSQEGLMVFLLPKCVEIKTILRELLFTVDNCLDNYAGIPCFATNMQPKTAFEHIEQLNKTEKCIYQIWVLCIISDNIFPKHVCINFPFRLNGLQKVCMISIWMQ